MPPFPRALKRTLKIVASTLLLLLLLGTTGWLSRHHWIPPLANQFLDGIEVRRINGLTISRTEPGLGLSIQALELVNENRLTVRVQELRLDKLMALFRPSADQNGDRINRAVLTLGRMEIASEATALANPGNQSSTSGSADTDSGRLSPTVSAPSSSNSSARDKRPEQVSISRGLATLYGLPLQKLLIHRLIWLDHIDTPLSLVATFRTETSQDKTANATGRQLISAELTSSRCSECRISWSLVNQISRANSQLQLFHQNISVAELSAALTRRQNAVPQNSVVWDAEAKLEAAAQPLLNLLNAAAISMPTSPLTEGTALSGTLNARTLSELPDQIERLNGLKDITLELGADALHIELPETIGGIPLAISVNSIRPLAAKVPSLAPFQVESLAGEFSVAVSNPGSNAVNVSRPATILKSDIALATEEQIPLVEFNGEYDLAQANDLLRSPKWQKVLSPYRIGQLSGLHRITGRFSLPKVEEISNRIKNGLIHDFSATIHPAQGQSTELTVTLPEKNNPLAFAQWQRIHTRLSTESGIEISAAALPGSVTLKAADLQIASTAGAGSEPLSSDSPSLNGRLQAVQCSGLPGMHCQLQLKAELPALAVEDAAMSLKDLSVESSLTLDRPSENTQTRLVFQALNITADQLKSGAVTIDSPEVFAERAGCDMEPDTLRCNSPQLALSLAPLALVDNQLSGVLFLEELTIEKKPWEKKSGEKRSLKPLPQANSTTPAGTRNSQDNEGTPSISAAAKFHTDSLNLTALGQYKTTFASKGQLRLSNDLVTGSGQVTSGPLSIETSWKHNLKTGQGSSQLNLPQATFTPVSPLSHAIQGLPADIVDGTLSADAKVHWPQSDRDQVTLSMENAAIQYGDTVAVGINLSTTLLQQSGNWVTPTPAPVSIQKVDAGVAIENLHFSLSAANSGDVTLQRFAAELLDGVLTSDALTWSLKGEERQSLLQFTGISMGALAKEMESQNFAASGLLDATIPITADAQGITVENGTLQSRAPGGRLRYYGAFSPSMLGSNPQLKLLAGALEDYNYQDIRGTITYPLSGDLTLNLKLTGRSAAIDANRDLIINLNLENNIPTMLRSLQASRDLTDVLEQQVQ
ncbi:YdbH domain-containing protein [Microbulbifer sp. CAU 1566]|uniref:intermembrane phospholipid transport protein YdbH family protein n=1 Tax=Microbulbifer sp. CAU 1566 TaxID=2933269 RepID=UPI0020038E06|nr:YdbH domain-containing protein [Microbulbifer sp. CAU 1566]